MALYQELCKRVNDAIASESITELAGAINAIETKFSAEFIPDSDRTKIQEAKSLLEAWKQREGSI